MNQSICALLPETKLESVGFSARNALRHFGFHSKDSGEPCNYGKHVRILIQTLNLGFKFN